MHTSPAIKDAVLALQRGGVIAYPTEAVFGLGCDPSSEPAVRRILALKNRPVSQGLILVASHFHQLEEYLALVPPDRLQRALDTWPGPYTWLIPARKRVPRWLRGDHATLAVRVSAHPVVRALCDALGMPIVSTSANPSGQPPARTAEEVRRYFGDALDVIVPGEVGGRAAPTEIRDLMTGEVVRPG